MHYEIRLTLEGEEAPLKLMMMLEAGKKKKKKKKCNSSCRAGSGDAVGSEFGMKQ